MHVGALPTPRFWLIIGFFFTILLSPLLVHFAAEYPRHKSGVMWLVFLWYGIALVFEAGNLLGKIVERAELIPGSGGVVNIEFGPMMTYAGWPYMTLTIFVMAALFIHSYRSTNSRDERLMLRYPLVGTLFLFGGGLINIFPTLTGYPFDFLANITFAMVIAYAISKHQFLNIRIVVRRNLASIISVLSLSALFILVLREIEGHIRVISGFYLWLMMVPIAAALTVLLFAMRERLQPMIDRLFFGESYDYRKTLLMFSQEMGASLKLQELAKGLLKMLCGSLNCDKAVLLLPSMRGDFFELRASLGFEDEHLARDIRIPSDDPFVIWARRHGRPLSRTEIEIMSEPSNALIGDIHWLEALSYDLVCPLIIRDNVIGFIVLGPKRSQHYEDEDLLLILTISHQVAVAIDNARLYTESQRTYAELKKAQDNLVRSERMHALGQMAGGVAHDFNNMLTAILGRAQMTLHQIKDKKAIRNLQIIEQAALDAAETVRRLQDFARVRTDHAFNIIDLNEVLKAALEIIKPRLDEQRETLDTAIELNVDLAEISPVEGNAGELREAFINILINSIQAMPNGGQLTISSRQEGDSIVILVSDTGIGMTSDVRRRVFDPFFTTKEGLGMGLSIVYGTIKRHGGQIRVSSKPKMGSTFTIEIPVIQRSEVNAVEAGLQENNSNKKNKGATILVVDDDRNCRDILNEILVEDGHEVDVAANGREALSLAEQKHYDLVIADFGLSDISGTKVASHIKRHSSKTQVIIVTGWGGQLDLTSLEEQEINNVISKPFITQEVLKVVSQLLDKSHK